MPQDVSKNLKARKKTSEIKDQVLKDFGCETESDEDSLYPKNIKIKNYTFIKSIGMGSSSKVKLAINNNTKEKVAIKIIARKRPNPTMAKEKQEKREIRIYREILISALLKHPHIVRLIDFVYNEDYFFLVFEYAQGQQLFDIILDKGPMKELEARRIFRQIVSGIDYMHKNSIVHRDLKIENIIIDINGNVKIIDFGLSNFYDTKRFLTTFCGSLYFAAPELLNGQKYLGPEIDVWSLGIILYTMLCGFVPFDDKELKQLQQKIKHGKFEIPNYIEDSAKSLLLNTINIKSGERLTISEIIKAEWTNYGFKTEPDNYMFDRMGILELDYNLIILLEKIVFNQFLNIRDDLKCFENFCKNPKENNEKISWINKPIVSLYYLLLENKPINNKIDFSDLTTTNKEEIIKQFINYLFQKTEAKPGLVLQNLQVLEGKPNLESIVPKIRKSFIQGFFRGIKAKKVNCHNGLRDFIEIFCLEKNIAFEKHPKNYFCTLKRKNGVVHFKISLFFNPILDAFIISSKYLCGNQEIYEILRNQIVEHIKRS